MYAYCFSYLVWEYCFHFQTFKEDLLYLCWALQSWEGWTFSLLAPLSLILFCFWDRILLCCVVWSQTPGQGFLLSHFLMANDISLCPASVFLFSCLMIAPHLRIKESEYFGYLSNVHTFKVPTLVMRNQFEERHLSPEDSVLWQNSHTAYIKHNNVIKNSFKWRW